jgi:hypothetical protein
VPGEVAELQYNVEQRRVLVPQHWRTSLLARRSYDLGYSPATGRLIGMLRPIMIQFVTVNE